MLTANEVPPPPRLVNKASLSPNPLCSRNIHAFENLARSVTSALPASLRLALRARSVRDWLQALVGWHRSGISLVGP